ncbi:hypothetical protein BDF20DRAFT_832025 [Mycotypha africana]|uniref:uncharacterized protein n=1 Tax=Mycotypha africana TaxID=64632 RepID=UPI0022FFE9E9|nr:uncharacterized protein BDF20DRAFT_832025 [Mycotypha africana]KAI8992037.1 hypothetical protein BDF20DRAFT_832025 [Mycotypha africana]
MAVIWFKNLFKLTIRWMLMKLMVNCWSLEPLYHSLSPDMQSTVILFEYRDKGRLIFRLLQPITSSILAEQNRRKLSKKIRDLSTAKKLLIEVTLALHRNENVKHANHISLYKQLIAPKLKIMNAKAIKDKLYLL